MFERARSKREMVLIFLAILEMVKELIIGLKQSETFGDIIISKSEVRSQRSEISEEEIGEEEVSEVEVREAEVREEEIRIDAQESAPVDDSNDAAASVDEQDESSNINREAMHQNEDKDSDSRLQTPDSRLSSHDH